jgi:hypothetical protein
MAAPTSPAERRPNTTSDSINPLVWLDEATIWMRVRLPFDLEFSWVVKTTGFTTLSLQ